jgi:nicotinamidase-related amidase
MSQTSALLLVDVQESFRHRPYTRLDDFPSFFDRTNALVAGFHARDLPIVRVLHVEPKGAFSLESGWVTPMKEVPHEAALVIQKYAHSAFAGTPLAAWLTTRGIRRLVVAGIRTEQCCETTTRQASDSGFEVDYVTEATLTFPMTSAKGRVFSPEEIKERTELVLADRFARIKTAAEVVGEL